MEQEIWLPVIGKEGLYEVSNMGRVKSLPRIIKNSNNRSVRERIMAVVKNKGYVVVGLQGNKSNIGVHRLVAAAFIPNPDNKPFINHKNGVRNDNRVENLEWCTQKENVHHAFETGLIPTGEKTKQTTLSNAEVVEIYKKSKNQPHKTLAKEYNTTVSVVNHIAIKANWKRVLKGI